MIRDSANLWYFVLIYSRDLGIIPGICQMLFMGVLWGTENLCGNLFAFSWIHDRGEMLDREKLRLVLYLVLLDCSGLGESRNSCQTYVLLRVMLDLSWNLSIAFFVYALDTWKCVMHLTFVQICLMIPEKRFGKFRC